MLKRHGIHRRLLLAFVGITGFAVLAAGAAMIAVLHLGRDFHAITEERAPAVFAAQQLSRQAERLVANAPALLSVASEAEQQEVASRIGRDVARLKELLTRTERHSADAVLEGKIKPAVDGLVANLEALDRVVTRRLAASERKAALLQRLANTEVAARRLLTPGLLVLDSDLARLRRSVGEGGEPDDASVAAAARSIAALQPQQKARFEVSLINDTLLRAAVAEAAELPVLLVPLRRSLDNLQALSTGMAPPLGERMLARVSEFRRLVDSPESAFEVRKDELGVIEQGRILLAENATFAAQLTSAVEELVGQAEGEMTSASSAAREVQAWSTALLFAGIGLSLGSAVLILWLYVGRNLVGRLTALSDSMLAIAGGNLEAPIPADGRDEVAEMANALVVFRDTAMEVRRSNLREISEARRRLTDAIESLSEGFALFDAEDRLVVSNSRYREVLYPGTADVIEPGVRFAEVIRAAAERGLIADAKSDIEGWVARRLAQRANPGPPHLQALSDGRWIQIDERLTEDGGMVTIYTDVTELKNREAALAEKSQALEQLSSQLAKYLSPQVYNAIFENPSQVRLASQRKKLTVFFSDIAGFTETADRLESEELTSLINHYLTEMSRIAIDHGGTVDKYMGDGIMVFFGDPESRGAKEDALACVRMAIAMREKIVTLADVWRQAGILKPPKVRMGIHTGFCTVGNFGSEDRMDYTIIGGAANTAARLQSAATPGEILISYETFAQAREEIACEERGAIEVKGIAYPLATYRVVDAYAALGAERRHYREERPNLHLDLNLETMTAEEREEAAKALRHGLALLDQKPSAE